MTKTTSFLRLVIRGWKELKYPFATYRYYDPTNGGYCALGVAAKVLKPDLILTGDNYVDFSRVNSVLTEHNVLPADQRTLATRIQNRATTKNQAMRLLRDQLR